MKPGRNLRNYGRNDPRRDGKRTEAGSVGKGKVGACDERKKGWMVAMVLVMAMVGMCVRRAWTK